MPDDLEYDPAQHQTIKTMRASACDHASSGLRYALYGTCNITTLHLHAYVYAHAMLTGHN